MLNVNMPTVPDSNGTVQWRPVVGYEGFYDVSEFGAVRRACGSYRNVYKKGHILKWKTHPKGYFFVGMSNGERRKNQFIHKIVLQAFVNLKPKGAEGNHKDGDKANNHFTNLEWMTHQENIIHAASLGLMPRGENQNMAKLTDEQVRQIRKLDGTCSHRQLGARFGVSHCAIGNILRGKTWRHVK